MIFIALYRSPSQSSDEFETFLNNFESDLGIISSLIPYIFTILGDFNAKSSNWCPRDITSQQGFEIDAVTSYYGLHQLITEPTHVLPLSSSCIDLIFTSQPNLICDSGVLPSLCNNCHHNIVFAKFNLQIEYPPPFKRLVWNYDKADTNMIKRAATQFDWEKAFSNLCIDSKIETFNCVLLNIFSNFCPSKIITCNDNDPPWLTDKIKRMAQDKDEAYRQLKLNNEDVFQSTFFKGLTQELTDEIEREKNKYYCYLHTHL